MDDGRRVERLALRLRTIVWATMVLAVLLHIAARTGLAFRGSHLIAQATLNPDPGTAIAGDISAILFLVALWQLTAMLAFLGRGARFSAPVTRHFRHFALFLLLATLAVIVFPPIWSIAQGPRGGLFVLAFNFRDVWMLLVAAVLFLIARLLDEGQRIETDLREFV